MQIVQYSKINTVKLYDLSFFKTHNILVSNAFINHQPTIDLLAYVFNSLYVVHSACGVGGMYLIISLPTSFTHVCSYV